MGHINAALDWLIQFFNTVWPLVVSTFVGGWLAFQYIRRHEHRRELEQRFARLKLVYFVLSSQRHRLQRLQKNALQPYAASSRRAEMMPPIQLHDDFPRLDMPQLPGLFEQDSVELLNEMIDVEQRFLDVADLLKRRTRLIRAEPVNLAQLKVETDKLYEEVPILEEQYGEALYSLNRYMESQPRGIGGETLDYIAWMVCSVCGATAAVFFFSHWAINSSAVVEMGLDISLVSALVFALSLYFSLALTAIVFIMGVYTAIKKLKSSLIYVLSLLLAAAPVLYLMWADYNMMT
ncbi:MAG: hypothetical protein OEW58_03440 [Gammaproteobacteria bacterium]|nr:hypothetical protein [Gammaproteobacteria bacterium]